MEIGSLVFNKWNIRITESLKPQSSSSSTTDSILILLAILPLNSCASSTSSRYGYRRTDRHKMAADMYYVVSNLGSNLRHAALSVGGSQE